MYPVQLPFGIHLILHNPLSTFNSLVKIKMLLKKITIIYLTTLTVLAAKEPKTELNCAVVGDEISCSCKYQGWPQPKVVWIPEFQQTIVRWFKSNLIALETSKNLNQT